MGQTQKNGCEEARGHIGPVLCFFSFKFMDLDFVSVHKN